MPQPEDNLSGLDRVSLTAFVGMDASRNPASGDEYNLGVLAINLGRNQRQPLHARQGLQALTSDNDNHVFSGQIFALGALSQGNRLSLVARLSGGRLVAAKNVQIDED